MSLIGSVTRVVWVDSIQPEAQWHHLDSLPPLDVIHCQSVGWIVAENDDVLMLAQNIGDKDTKNAQASGLMRIPKACIVSRDQFN